MSDATPWIEVAPGHYQCTVGGLVDVQVMHWTLTPLTAPEHCITTVVETVPDGSDRRWAMNKALHWAHTALNDAKAAAYDREHDKTPITGEWLERHGVPSSRYMEGKKHWVMRAPGEGETFAWGFVSRDGDSSTLNIGMKLASNNATLGKLRTACRLFNVPMPMPKEKGKAE